MTETTYLRRVGMRIGNERRWTGVSQDDFAELAEVSRVTLGSIERGKHAGSVLTYLKIARTLGVTMGHLLNEETS
jgi:DNA-binding XRE family transcriptional regulator